MRKKRALFFCFILILMTTTGCWDTQLLTTKKIVNGVSLDVSKDNQISGTVRAIILESKGGGQFDVKDEIMQATGKTVFELGLSIDSMLPGTVEATKTHVIILGEELAKKGIMTPLEFFYRIPRSYLITNVLISTGLASDVLSFDKIETNPTAFGIKQMLDGAVRATVVHEQSLYSIWTQIFDPGEDTVIPMISKVKNKALIIDSSGLMDGDKFTGVTLPRDDSTLLLLLQDKLDKHAFMDISIQQDSGQETTKLSVDVRKLKRAFDVSVDPITREIECSIQLDLYGAISSYPANIGHKIDREKLNKTLSESLNKQAIGVTHKLLEANCDAIGIGRQLRVHHNKLWNNMIWKDEYKNVKFKTSVQVHITSTGIIK
jgi:Ger(x)C family germination protein